MNTKQRESKTVTTSQTTAVSTNGKPTDTTTTGSSAAIGESTTAASTNYPKSINRRAVRRSKKIHNKLKRCKILYLNIRGLKSKIE